MNERNIESLNTKDYADLVTTNNTQEELDQNVETVNHYINLCCESEDNFKKELKIKKRII